MNRVRASVVLVAAVIALLSLPAVAAAAAGDLDTAFGTGGATSLASGSDLFGVALQPDRQIVATGDFGSSLLVERFSATGAPEGAFAAGSGGSGVGRGIAVQSDGKIVVAGYDSAGMLVERFNSNGSLDTGFGSGGVVHAVPGGRANALALGPGGTIVAAGQVAAGDSFQRVIVLRLTSSGSPDSSIGPGGVHLIDLGEDSVAKGVAVQGDGKIVLAGSIGPGTHQGLAAFVARLSSNGVLDGGFGSGGTALTFAQAGGAATSLNAVALDPAGGIVAGGGSTSINLSQAVFERLTCSGTLDTSFAGTGQTITPSSHTFVTNPLGANAVTVAGGRRLIGAGAFRDSGLTSAALWGFEPGGSSDFANFAPSGAQANAIVVDPGGRLVVAGSNVPLGLAPSGFVARYSGFGGPASGSTPCGGLSTTPPPPPVQSPPSVSTGAASSVTSSAASLSGSVNPNGAPTTYHFDYGTSTAYGSQTTLGFAGPGTAAVTAFGTASGLASGTTYHYRVVASNSGGTAYGAAATFRTSGNPPPRPVISKLSQSSRSWAETKSSKHKRAVGTTFSFTLNVDARVVLTFTHQVAGRKVNGKCVAQTKQNKLDRACMRTVTDGTLSFAGHAGKNSFSFQGRISRTNQLKPGSYTVGLTATNAAGLKSGQQSLSFTITS